MRDNQGIEALAVLQGGPRKGSVVAFAERLTRGSGYHTGWIWDRRQRRAAELPAAGHRRLQHHRRGGPGRRRPAGARALFPLDRGREDAPAPHPGAARSRPARASPAARCSRATPASRSTTWRAWPCTAAAGGETIVSLISDDNFNHLLQRTLFLQFTLLDEGPRNASRP